MGPQHLLEIFGRGLDQLGPIMTPEQELRQQEKTIEPGLTPVGDIWPEADVCWGSLVGAGVGAGYLVGTNVSWGRRRPNQGPGRSTTF